MVTAILLMFGVTPEDPPTCFLFPVLGYQSIVLQMKSPLKTVIWSWADSVAMFWQAPEVDATFCTGHFLLHLRLKTEFLLKLVPNFSSAIP